jgi:hypothetical protein
MFHDPKNTYVPVMLSPLDINRLGFIPSLAEWTEAALKWGGPRTVRYGERIILTEHQPKVNEDEEFNVLMRSTSGGGDDSSASARLLPLHNYYGEFRLGQGDPLLKAAMDHWPCTTTDFSDPVVTPNRKNRPASCTALMDPASVASLLPFNDILMLHHLDLEHEHTVRERRFVLLDEQGHELEVGRRFSF